MTVSKKRREHLTKIGSLGGRAATHKGITSVKKAAAARRNGRKGGRKTGPNACTRYPSHRFNPKTGLCYGCRFKRPSA